VDKRLSLIKKQYKPYLGKIDTILITKTFKSAKSIADIYKINSDIIKETLVKLSDICKLDKEDKKIKKWRYQNEKKYFVYCHIVRGYYVAGLL
jgi:hypothetical protein